MRVIGLISGTSADGIDAALVRIEGRPPRIRLRLEAAQTLPYPAQVRNAILRVAEGAATTTGELSRLHMLLGELFAWAARRVCRAAGCALRDVALIGSHGQTVYHQGRPERWLTGQRVAATLQIGEPAVIAARTGRPVVADFRPADLAVGGQGAPLVPLLDYLLYRHPTHGRVALNIGGIANVTVIPAGGGPKDVLAFDTGPGNMVIDALVRRFTKDRRRFDRDGQMAARGRPLRHVLDRLLADPFFRRPPPKSAGREQFGQGYVDRFLSLCGQARPEDVVATATALTALSILDALHRFVRPRWPFDELIVSGGGARNPVLVAQMAAGLAPIRVRLADEFSIPSRAKEAVAFALLAYETWHGRPGNILRATGARQFAILGKICFPPRALGASSRGLRREAGPSGASRPVHLRE